MSDLQSLSALDGVSAAGRFGNPDGNAGVTLTERASLGLATLEVRKDQAVALAERVQAAYGAALPRGPISANGTGVRFIGIAPGQWFAVSETLPNEALADDLATKLHGLASVADHSSGRAVMRLEGPAVREVLAKGLAVDIDSRVFLDGAAAVTSIGHMGVLVWRDGEAFDLAVFRSFASSFYGWLRASAAEFGIDVVT
ncbi:MAG: sarcosine oxidase subunit gamma family protein [Methyloceanibacter sp.]|nr:sarcosine oxidase subunit gamma family protein [Methyloceanibacter sp.]